MEERSNKTIISSVLFLDIVEYSKKSVTGQISLKDRFNTYLSEAIHDVPVADRIILDTGDGAAVTFMVDVESALSAALRLRASLLAEDPYMEPQLLVRIGINLGPVRLVRDINGQPNIVGDGINVAQRVMAFAEASQILVSRSYYDAVSRLSAEYTGMFHYQGSRTDKHVREHEIYAIGYPGDQTTKRLVAQEEATPAPTSLVDRVKSVLFSSVAQPSVWSDKVKQASVKQRALYAGLVILPLMLLTVMLMRVPTAHQIEPAKPVIETMPAVSAVPVVSAVPETSAVKKADEVKPADNVAAKETSSKPAVDKNGHDKHKPEPVVKKVAATGKSGDAQNKADTAKKTEATNNEPEAPRETRLSVICKEGTQVFVDGAQKGKMTADSMVLTIKPGKHKVILTHPSFGLYNEEIDADPGKTERVKPKVCN